LRVDASGVDAVGENAVASIGLAHEETVTDAGAGNKAGGGRATNMAHIRRVVGHTVSVWVRGRHQCVASGFQKPTHVPQHTNGGGLSDRLVASSSMSSIVCKPTRILSSTSNSRISMMCRQWGSSTMAQSPNI